MTSLTVILLALLPLLYALKNNCPVTENIAPLCICKDLGNGPMMLCSNVLSPDDLIPPIQETEKHNMFSLAIHDSSLLFFPNKLFKRTNFKKVSTANLKSSLIQIRNKSMAYVANTQLG